MQQLVVMQLRNKRNLKATVNNPYTNLLVSSLPEGRVRTTYFSWKTMLTERFDVLHVHWPEQIVRHPRPLVAQLKSAFFLLFLLRIRLQRKAIVRTVHNLAPHEAGSSLERIVLRQLDRQTTLWLVLNKSTPTADPDRTVVIEHGHYRDWYEEPPAEATVPGRLLAFGMIRAYKGIDDLVSAFRSTTDHSLSLHICGRPDGDETRVALAELADGDSRVKMTLEFIPDDVLGNEIAAAEAVVLPYREIHNSGVALLALSMNRPIIVRRSASTELLEQEFGTSWVHLFDSDLTGATLEHALTTLRAAQRPERVDMSSRDWTKLASQLAEAYDRAFESVRWRRRQERHVLRTTANRSK